MTTTTTTAVTLNGRRSNQWWRYFVARDFILHLAAWRELRAQCKKSVKTKWSENEEWNGAKWRTNTGKSDTIFAKFIMINVHAKKNPNGRTNEEKIIIVNEWRITIAAQSRRTSPVQTERKKKKHEKLIVLIYFDVIARTEDAWARDNRMKSFFLCFIFVQFFFLFESEAKNDENENDDDDVRGDKKWCSLSHHLAIPH